MRNGKPTGEYEDFMTGFVTADGDVWGRPVGVAVAHDGSLLVTEDVNDRVTRLLRRREVTRASHSRISRSAVQ